jgi:polysaccharide chain length determinant protein (PEP-CTERM system associated)
VYSPADVLRIVRDRKWLIVIPFAAGVIGAVGVSRSLPELYRSETLIMVMPQRIPETYAKPIVTGRIEDRLLSISDQILSRSRLERIIADFDLYAEQRARGTIMEDLVQRMRNEITVRLEGKESFRVTYVNGDASVAQKVTERLASLSIEENLRDRQNLTESTNELLESQLQDAKRRLVEHERKLEEYRRRYAGQLPTQVASNLQVIQNAQLQLQALAEATNRERERRLLLERQLADLTTPDPVAALAAAAAVNTPGGATANASPAVQLESARARLVALQTQYTPQHPDVVAMKKTIKDLEAKVAAEAELASEPDRPLTPVDAARHSKMKDLRAQIEVLDLQLKDKAQEELRLRGVIAEYQGKVDVVPTRESELVELTRDYATLQETYSTLLAKREESKLAANLERRQYGEQFKVIDPASLPEKPFNQMTRLGITAAVALSGLLLGLGFVGLLEYRDASFRTDEDVQRVLALPVLAVVPALAAGRSGAWRFWRRKRTGHAAATVVFIAAAAMQALAARGLQL